MVTATVTYFLNSLSGVEVLDFHTQTTRWAITVVVMGFSVETIINVSVIDTVDEHWPAPAPGRSRLGSPDAAAITQLSSFADIHLPVSAGIRRFLLVAGHRKHPRET
jgi:hypothetical protein